MDRVDELVEWARSLPEHACDFGAFCDVCGHVNEAHETMIGLAQMVGSQLVSRGRWYSGGARGTRSTGPN